MQEWVFSADLTAPAKLVLFALIYHANKDTGLAFPSQETIAAKTSQHKTTVGRALKLLEEKGMIEYLGNSGRSDTYRVNYISGSSPPKAKNSSKNKTRNMSRSTASDVAESNSRYCIEQHQVLHRAISDIAESDTNQSINQKQSTNPPTQERMFEEFWAAYPDRCPRKVDRAKCRQKHAAILADSADPSRLHETMLDSLKRWDASEMWNKEDGRFIRAPYAWLDRRSWEDAPAPDKALVAKKATAKRTYDWTLCAERYSNCGGDRCRVGVKVPPNYSEWASPPEECRYFRAAS